MGFHGSIGWSDREWLAYGSIVAGAQAMENMETFTLLKSLSELAEKCSPLEPSCQVSRTERDIYIGKKLQNICFFSFVWLAHFGAQTSVVFLSFGHQFSIDPVEKMFWYVLIVVNSNLLDLNLPSGSLFHTVSIESIEHHHFDWENWRTFDWAILPNSYVCLSEGKLLRWPSLIYRDFCWAAPPRTTQDPAPWPLFRCQGGKKKSSGRGAVGVRRP